MKTFTKSFLLLFLSILVLPVFLLTTYAEQNDTYSIEIKDNQIFLDNKQLTNSPNKKDLPLISPDKNNIAFRCIIGDNSTQLGIVNIKEMIEKNIVIGELFDQIMNIEWLNNQKVGVEIHINPSLDCYTVCDIESNKILDQYYGYNFILDKAKSNILYIQSPPQSMVVEGEGEYMIMLNSSMIYQTNKSTMIDYNLCPTPTFKKIAFYENNTKDESKSNIIILSLTDGKVKTTKKIVWNKKIYELKWDNENILSIGSFAKYDTIKSKLILK